MMKDRRLPIVVFSLLFAFLVWVSVNLGNQFQSYIEVPVRIENLRSDQAIAVPLPGSVRFKIQGTGWQLLNTMISPRLNFTIDFAAIGKNYVQLTSKEFIDHINISNTIRIFDANPEMIEVRLDEKVTKKVPIVGMIQASYRDGFDIVGRVKTNPDSVVITGARSLLNTIQEWETETIVLNDINIPISLKVALNDSLSFEISRSTSVTSVSFDVQPIAEKTIRDIPIDIVQVPMKRNVVLIPPKLSIIIRSGVNNIANLSVKDFNVFIDYKSILLDTSGMIVPIIAGPENVKIVHLDPDKIQYVVRK